MHLVEEVITVVLVGNGNEFLKAPRSNVFDQPIMVFCYSIPNFGRKSKSLGSGFTVQPCRGINRVGYLPLKQTKRMIKNGHKYGRRKFEENYTKITLSKNLTKTSNVRGYQVGFLSILGSHILYSAMERRLQWYWRHTKFHWGCCMKRRI